jgi:hypothetical protein
MFSFAKKNLMYANIFPGSKCHKEGALVASALLEKEFLLDDEYFALTGHDIGQKLLEENVFAFHFDSNMVTFQSTLMKRFCEEKTSSWAYEAEEGGVTPKQH